MVGNVSISTEATAVTVLKALQENTATKVCWVSLHYGVVMGTDSLQRR